uniref:Uncharacterized protein n=3 Tax=Candidatus Kentrum sp. DK TaxID=2126562 RepID=A0A450SPX0_9GAMM|nr:MAG: hypothetical protein BECKDK2373B_GA0170837_105522 [Candidatus Kentron sp. DK]
MDYELQNKVERGTRSLSDLGVRREGKRDRDQNLCKFEANSGLFNEDLRKFWPISAFPQQNHPKSDRLLVIAYHLSMGGLLRRPIADIDSQDSR